VLVGVYVEVIASHTRLDGLHRLLIEEAALTCARIVEARNAHVDILIAPTLSILGSQVAGLRRGRGEGDGTWRMHG